MTNEYLTQMRPVAVRAGSLCDINQYPLLYMYLLLLTNVLRNRDVLGWTVHVLDSGSDEAPGRILAD
jgi:hypothetical protein